MPKISVIVPIYKVENYLKTCIKSLLHQTFSDIEIILVDDGSPDNCGIICDEYAKKDSRIRVIHKKNSGLSAARNTGIDFAKGEYIGFIDSDDFIERDMYELLYKNIIENLADVSICGIEDCFANKNVSHNKVGKRTFVFNNIEALGCVLEGKIFPVSAVNKLFKKSLFETIRFPVGKLYEDAFTIPRILSLSSKVVFTPEVKYHYFHRKNSITTSTFKKSDFDMIEAYKQNFKMVQKEFPSLIKLAEFRLLWSYIYVLDKMILSSEFNFDENYNNILNLLHKEIFNIIKNPYFSFNRKLAMFILQCSPKLYTNLLIYKKRKNMELNN